MFCLGPSVIIKVLTNWKVLFLIIVFPTWHACISAGGLGDTFRQVVLQSRLICDTTDYYDRVALKEHIQNN